MNTVSPILYEVNARVWLSELSERAGQPLSISDIPDAEIERFRSLGFTHLWLMGVWQVGPEARALALQQWREHWSREVPSTEGDVRGSPYAVQEYAVDGCLGQPLDLLMLKERLNRAGIRLILDFVPNHFGIDSTEPRRYPARFVQAPEARPGTFPCETKLGIRHLAHGRDPFFAPWNDTVQIDFRVAEAQEAMSLIAQTISMFGDGLRCDMAMLLLPDIFHETWKEFSTAGAHPTSANFWKRAIPKIKLLQPSVELIAECYWDREKDLQDLGFDYTYNKRVTDFLVRGQTRELKEFLLDCPFLPQGVHFLENHDEAGAASVFPFELHKAAAALILFLPGMALLHDGQLEGRRARAHIQMTKRPPEPLNPDVQQFYGQLLAGLQKTNIRRGVPELLRKPGDVIAIQWRGRDGTRDLALVNLTANPAEFALDGHWAPFYSTRPLSAAPSQTVKVPPESAHILRQGAA